jgi:hypothetical protein
MQWLMGEMGVCVGLDNQNSGFGRKGGAEADATVEISRLEVNRSKMDIQGWAMEILKGIGAVVGG